MAKTCFVFLTVAVFFSSLAEASLCADLQPADLQGRWAIAPLRCDPARQAACDKVTKELADCLSKNKIPMATEEGVRAAGSEQVFGQLLAGQSSDKLAKFGEQIGARYLALAELTLGKKDSGLVRVVNVQDGSVVRVVRYLAGSATPNPTEETVSEGLARLAQRLAAGYAALGAQTKGKRLAVLNFQEHGVTSTKNSLGTLVSAELITRLHRDYSLPVVERSRLDQVLKELELGQTGLVDDKVAPKLGKLLEASVLLLGAVNDAGGSIRINAQMVDVTTGITIVADGIEVRAANLVALSSDAVVLRSKSGAVFRSLLIPGWGQFYNQQAIKGGTVIGLAGGVGIAAITCEILAASAENSYEHAKAGANFDLLAQRVGNFSTARNILLGALAVVWVYNLIDAYAYGVTFDSAVGTSGSGAVSLTPFGLLGRF